jgi:hypothetical protein
MEPSLEEPYLEYQRQIVEKYKEPAILEIKKRHEAYIRKIIENQEVEYHKLAEKGFFSNSHETVQIMELKDCVDYVKYGLTIDFINKICEENSILRNLRDSLSCSILSVTADPANNYLYGPTIRVIVKILDFYDIIIRSIKEVPPYYHKYRYERYIEHCISIGGLFIIPTFAYIGATDLLKLRPYPLFPVGLSITLQFVDEFFQSPIEFFTHDINHIRRMYEANIIDMKKNGIDNPTFVQMTEYYQRSKTCLDKILGILENKPVALSDSVSSIEVPTITPRGEIKMTPQLHLTLEDYSTVEYETPIDMGYAQLIKIILFEITHEDALPMQEHVVCETILRNSGIETAFPRITVGDSAAISINLEKGGSILGFVKYKLRNGFFDSIEMPLDVVVKHYYRTDKQIAIATQILLAKLCNNRVSNTSPEYKRILINITDKSGLNKPVNPDLITHYMPEIITDPTYGDLTDEEINNMRREQGITEENLFTGERPKPVTEQGNLLGKLGGSKTRQKKGKMNKRKTYKKMYIIR